MTGVVPVDDPRLAAAVEAAERAGEIQRDRAGSDHDVEYKGRRDLVTDVDLRSETAITDLLDDRFPDHAILAEESGATGDADERWIVDPLDGTTNFFHGLPHYGVCVALEDAGRLEVGVIHHTPSGDTYAALRGAGAFRNGDPIDVSAEPSLEASLIATGFGHDGADDVDVARMQRVIAASHGIRRLGSAATDLALVAEGRVEGFYHEAVHYWDVAAGAILVAEAGGETTLVTAEPPTADGPVLATNGHIHDDLADVVA